MTPQEFAALSEQGLIYLDGATGTNLFKAGMPKGICTESWVLENPDMFKDLQQRYAEAGSQIVYAPTFGANREALRKFHLEDRVYDMNKRLVSLSQDAVQGRAFVAGDMAPTGLLLKSSGGDADDEQVFEAYEEQARALIGAGVDLIVLETMMSVNETSIALDAVLSVTGDLPVMCSLYVTADGRAYYDGTIYEAAEIFAVQGASAIGINCCNGPDQLEAIVSSLSRLTDVPVLCKPNAGMPHIDGQGNAVYDMGPDEYAGHMKTLIEAGARVIGGCCGTDPAYIRKIRLMMDGRLIGV